jgi:hypothetical protein
VLCLPFTLEIGESDLLFRVDDWRINVDFGSRLTQLADIHRVECSSAQVQDGNVLRRGECRNVLSL